MFFPDIIWKCQRNKQRIYWFWLRVWLSRWLYWVVESVCWWQLENRLSACRDKRRWVEIHIIDKLTFSIAYILHVNLSPTKINIIYFHNQDAPPQSSPMMQVYHVINTAKALDTWQDKLCLIRTGVDAGNMKVPARAILWWVGRTMGTWFVTTINVRLVSDR